MEIPLYVKVLVAVLSALYVRSWVLKYRAARRYRRFARQNGCEEPPVDKTRLPGGIEKVLKFLRVKEDFLGEIILPPFYKLGWTYRDYGMLGRQAINTVDPANIQTMLVWKFNDFGLGPVREQMFGPLLGPGIATSDGEMWHHSRRAIRPQFTSPQITSFDMVERNVQRLFQAIDAFDDSYHTSELDLMPLLGRYTLDNVTALLWGSSDKTELEDSAFKASTNAESTAPPTNASRTLQADDESVEAFARNFRYAQDYLSFRLRFMGFYWLLNSTKFQASCVAAHKFVDECIGRSIRLKQDNKSGSRVEGKPRFVLVDSLLSQPGVNLKWVRDQLLHLLAGGRDTTAGQFAWLMTMVTMYPEVFRRLESEVLSLFGPDSEMNSPDHDQRYYRITSDRIKSITYLRWVINETQRLYPSVPMNNRIAMKDTVLPHGGGPDGQQPVAVMRGTLVSYTVYGMHRRKDLWGEDADIFKPERWENRKTGPEFLPFNAGPRVCIGQHFALNQISYGLIRLIQRYEMPEFLDPHTTVKQTVHLGLIPADGVKIRLRRRE